MKLKFTNHLKKNLTLFIILISSSVFSQTPVTYTANPTDAQIITQLTGSNVTITGGVLNYGDRAIQIATFNRGLAAALEMANGVFFGTGNVVNLLRTNDTIFSTDDLTTATYNDPDLSALDPTANNNVVSYTVSVKLGPKATAINIAYQFGSEEYPDYVGSAYDDAFGFFVSGPGISGSYNLARLPNGNYTSVNKVNVGIPGISSSTPVTSAFDGSQSSLYINNGHGTNVANGKLTYDHSGPVPVAVQFNGLTKRIAYSITGLTPGATYSFKIIIADSFDGKLDSGVFVDSIYGTATLVANNDAYTITSGSSSTTSILNNDTVNGLIASLSDVFLSQVSSTNAGIVLDPTTGLISVNSSVPAGVYTLTYQICDKTYPSNCKTGVATITVPISYCYKTPSTSGTELNVTHGITALGRAGDDGDGNTANDWPMVRKGAWTALEAKTKGFVLNRLTDSQIASIPSSNLVEGMAVYSITQDCLQINIDGTSTGWRCFNTQTCPD